MSFLLDTNIIGHLVRDPQGPIATRAGAEEPNALMTSVVVIGEISFGFSRQPSRSLERQTAKVLRGIHVLDLDQAAAAAYGEIRAELERLGTRIGSNDLWIAAHALSLDATLVTANEREFSRVPGLRVENWAAA